MLFDAQLQVAQLELGNAEDHIQMAFLIALSLPAGPQQIIPIPAGILRFGFNKEASLEHANKWIELANDLPDPKPESDLIIAQNLSGVDAAVEQMDKFGGTKKS